MTSSPSDIVHPKEAPVPAETVRLPERGFTVDRTKALIAAAVFFAGWGLMVWLVTHDMVRTFDRNGLLFYRTGADFHARGGSALAEAVRDVTALGGVTLSTAMTIGAIVALLFLRLRREATLFGATVILGWLVNDAMKWLVGRPRPQIVPHLTEAGGNSFPSGHSFASAMIYIGMALAFASLSKRHSVRYTLVGTAMAVSLLIAWSRVLLGVHYPSDVTAGWLGGAGWAFLAAAVLYKPARAVADSKVGDKLEAAAH
jgi:undecaprenyl-diphosphatase